MIRCPGHRLYLGSPKMGVEKKPFCFSRRCCWDPKLNPTATHVSVISACTGLEPVFEQCALLHGHVVKLGFGVNTFAVSSLIDCYSKCGRINEAILLLGADTERDNILLNSMISGYSQNLLGEEALKLFVEMRNNMFSPTNHTLIVTPLILGIR